jgi:acyl-coenzyme A thioesterase PaaI-like protein
MDSSRVGPFWDAIEGRAPMPPAARLLGWQLEAVDPAAGTITVRYEARSDFTNPMGNIQGGFIAAMLDEAMGPALVATLPPDQFAPTLEMKISFFEAAKVGPFGRMEESSNEDRRTPSSRRTWSTVLRP